MRPATVRLSVDEAHSERKREPTREHLRVMVGDAGRKVGVDAALMPSPSMPLYVVSWKPRAPR